MDDLKPLISSFTRRNQTIDYSQNQAFYRQREYDYEKLSVSSLILGSAGAITLILTLSGNSSSPDSFLSSLLLTLFGFLVSLLLAGVAQFLLNEVSSVRFEQYTLLANKQKAHGALEKFDSSNKILLLASQLTSLVSHEEEKTSDERFLLWENYILCWKEADNRTIRADKLDFYIAWLMRIAAASFLFAIGLPIIKLILGLDFYGY